MTKAPRGAPDLLPPASGLLNKLEATGRKLFDAYGYKRIETPLFEHTEVFERAAGESSDVVLDKQMYTFNDRRERSLTLRPEGTAGICRAFVEHGLGGTMPLPIRLYEMSWMFRYERPQKGRNRQFHQIDAECIGSAEPIIDAELLILAWQFLKEIGVETTLLLNSMGHPADRAAYFDALRAALGDRIDDMCDDCHVRLEKNPLRVFDCKVPTCKEILRSGDIPPIVEYICDDCRAHFNEVQEILESVGMTWKNDPYLVRGFDYYTRTVFEFEAEGFGARGTVCAGGRYDGLIELLGGPPTPAVGLAIGSEPLMVIMKERGDVEDAGPDVYVIWMEGLSSVATAVALDLRAAGKTVRVSDAPKKIGSQLKTADRVGARKAVILGSDEVARGVAKLKDMESGDEEEVALSELKARLAEGA